MGVVRVVVGSPQNTIISYDVQKYEDTFQSGDFSEIEKFVYIE